MPARPNRPETDPVASPALTAAVATLNALIAAKQDSATAATDAELASGLALKQSLSERGQASGYPGLDGSGKLATSTLPALAITSVSVVASQATQLALSAQEGDLAVRSDQKKSYVHNGGSAGTMADWTLLDTPTDLVLSVNGQTGTVVLAKADVGLSNVDNTPDSAKPVSNAQQAALDAKLNAAEKAVASGVASLSAASRVAQSPKLHAADHAPGGTDALAVDQTAATGSLRTLGTGAAQAAAGTDARLSDARAPTAHKTSHAVGGSDVLSKADIGLGSVDNTTDAGKPVSSAQQTALDAKALKPDVQVFTANGTWNKPAGATVVEVVLIGGGHGGGSGRRTASGTVGCGGGGGGGAGWARALFKADQLGATEAVVVGAGGAGGAAVAVDSTSGNAGTLGGVSDFGAGKLRVQFGGSAGGGTTTSGLAGNGSAGSVLGVGGGSASGAGAAGGAGSPSTAGGAGGGAGGGVAVTPAPANGGVGAGSYSRAYVGFGAAGVAPGGAGGAATSDAATSTPYPGKSGGGGASSITAAGGDGGAGANYGGGGGGGGASLNGANSGAGGAGAPGIVVVTSW